jgi:RNA polymerase sigma factor (sigma-70 family)
VLVRFFRNKVDQAAEDLIQATFVACLESHVRYEGRGEFRGFLLGIARHKLYQHYRRDGPVIEDLDLASHSFADLAPGASTALAERAEEQLLLHALRSIPVELQVVLELFYWEALTAGEIATICEAPEGTIRTRIRSARQRLAVRLAELAAGEGELAWTESDLDRWAASVRRSWQR